MGKKNSSWAEDGKMWSRNNFSIDPEPRWSNSHECTPLPMEKTLPNLHPTPLSWNLSCSAFTYDFNKEVSCTSEPTEERWWGFKVWYLLPAVENRLMPQRPLNLERQNCMVYLYKPQTRSNVGELSEYTELMENYLREEKLLVMNFASLRCYSCESHFPPSLAWTGVCTFRPYRMWISWLGYTLTGGAGISPKMESSSSWSPSCHACHFRRPLSALWQ